MTGASSQGFICGEGCSGQILSMRDNIVEAVATVGSADAAFDENYDLFWGGARRFRQGAASKVADPKLVDPAAGNLHLQSSSPAIDAASDLGLTADFDGAPMPVDGNGDGRAAPDVGAYEYSG